MSEETAPSDETEKAAAAPAPEPAPVPTGPDADELRAIEALYEAGDFAEVNRRARVLAEKATDDAVKARATALTGRVQLDPFVLYAWAGTVVVVAGIVYYYVIR